MYLKSLPFVFVGSILILSQTVIADSLEVKEMKCVTVPSHTVEIQSESKGDRKTKKNKNVQLSYFYAYFDMKGLLLGDEVCPASLIDKHHYTAMLKGVGKMSESDKQNTYCVYDLHNSNSQYLIEPKEQGSPKLILLEKKSLSELLVCPLNP